MAHHWVQIPFQLHHSTAVFCQYKSSFNFNQISNKLATSPSHSQVYTMSIANKGCQPLNYQILTSKIYTELLCTHYWFINVSSIEKFSSVKSLPNIILEPTMQYWAMRVKFLLCGLVGFRYVHFVSSLFHYWFVIVIL